MSEIIEDSVAFQSPDLKERFYDVFLAFREPDGSISFFYGDGTSDCGVYAALATIFERTPKEVCEILVGVASGNAGFMQRYLSQDEASGAIAKASLFAHVSRCHCFFKQGAYFYMKEV